MNILLDLIFLEDYLFMRALEIKKIQSIVINIT